MLGELNKASDFRVGTTGWTADDLDDPQIERLWFLGHYEIFEGALVEMPPSYFGGGIGLSNLLFLLKLHCKNKSIRGDSSIEADIVINQDRVVRADAVWLSGADLDRQTQVASSLGKTELSRTRILIPPTLVIENISPGHERRDRVTKRAWYAEFGVPNYWILDVFERSLECLTLRDSAYQQDAFASKDTKFRTSVFPDLELDTRDIWST